MNPLFPVFDTFTGVSITPKLFLFYQMLQGSATTAAENKPIIFRHLKQNTHKKEHIIFTYF